MGWSLKQPTADKKTVSLNNETIRQAVLALLSRPWFRRIWVLQEVAAARRILIMCGSAEIDGHAFCLGVPYFMQKSRFHGDAPFQLQILIHSVTYLIRGAIFRSRCPTSGSGMASLNICPLGDLVDMYHTREATDRRDKVYALISMSSDNSTRASLSPDYNISWTKLLEQLVKFLLGEKASVQTWANKEMAIIKCKGYILGQVADVDSDFGDSRQNVRINFKRMFGEREYMDEWGICWTLQTSAKHIQEGDLVCLLQGALKPSIIRIYEDFVDIVMISSTPEEIGTDDGVFKALKPFQSITKFRHDFLLVWDWRRERDWNDYLDFLRLGGQNQMIASGKGPYKTIRLRNIGRTSYGLKEEVPSKRLKNAERLCIQLMLQIGERAQRAAYLDMLGSIVNLTPAYRDQGHSWKTKKLRKMTHLLKLREQSTQFTEGEVAQIARSFDEEVMTLLLERSRDEVLITKRVLQAAACNKTRGKEVMLLLLERGGDDVHITEGVVKAAARNQSGGKEVIKLLLEQRNISIKTIQGLIKSLELLE